MMKGSFIILFLMVVGTSAWQYVNVPKGRPNNCGCLSDIFCKVVYVNPKTVNKAESKFGRIQVEEKKISLNVVFDDLGSDLGGGISGSLIEADGRPYTVEPCRKNTDNERQFHRLVRQHLMIKLDEEFSGKEEKECCQYSENCEKVDLNLDLFDQKSLESVYLETSIDPNNYFDVKTADLFKFKQNQKLGQKTSEKIYTNEGKLLTLTSNGKARSALMTMRDGTELFSLNKCGENYFWRSIDSPKETYGPGARSKDGNNRQPKQEYDSPPSLESLFLEEDPSRGLEEDKVEIVIRADQGADTCYYGDQYYCQLSQDDYVGGEGIVLDENNTTDTIGQNWCNTKCNETVGCEFFTWTNFRSVQMCYLMTACLEDWKDPCLKDDPQVCMSGPKNCAPLENNANCSTLQDWGPGYVDWQCRDYLGNTVDAYDLPSIPWGTVCIQSCDSWRALGSSLLYPIEAHLKSTCTVHGNWSDTVAYDGQGVLLFPPPTYNSEMNPSSAYPVPNDPQSVSLMCECDALQLKWPTTTDVLNNPSGNFYDPNTEKMTDFLCDYDIDTYTVITNNTCTLLCDNYLTAVVRCWDGGWTGKPTLGFWCQNEPGQDRGPVIYRGSSLLITGGTNASSYIIDDVGLYPPSCPTNPLPNARGYHVTFKTNIPTLGTCGGTLNGRFDGVPTNSCIVFDKATKLWVEDSTRLNNLAEPRFGATAVELNNGVYILGGMTVDPDTESTISTSEFLPNGENIWQPGPQIPGFGSLSSCSVSITPSSFLLIGGGKGGPWGSYSNQVRRYDQISDSWASWTPLNTARKYQACAKVGNKVVVSGGFNGNALDSTEIIDLITETVTTGGNLPTTLFGHGMATIGSGVFQPLLAFGGFKNESFASVTADVLEWDDTTDTWTASTSIPNLDIPKGAFGSVAAETWMVCS